MRSVWTIGFLGVGLVMAGCGDKSTPPKGDAPSAEAKKADKPEGATKPAAEEPEEEEEAPSGLVDGLPAALEGKLKRPSDFVTLEPGITLAAMDGPKGLTFQPRAMGAPTWRAVSSGALVMSMYDHNPAGDSGPDCPTVDAMKAKVTGAKTLLDVSFSNESIEQDGKTLNYGDEVQLFMFEKDGKVGFYARKVFDHGDDATTVCAAPGKPNQAPELTALVEREQANVLAASFMTLRESF